MAPPDHDIKKQRIFWLLSRRRSGMPLPAEEVPQWLFCGEPLADAELAQVAQEIDGALWHSFVRESLFVQLGICRT